MSLCRLTIEGKEQNNSPLPSLALTALVRDICINYCFRGKRQDKVNSASAAQNYSCRVACVLSAVLSASKLPSSVCTLMIS
jgi:hypothetical protein